MRNVERTKLNRKSQCKKQSFSSRTKESTIGTHASPRYAGCVAQFKNEKRNSSVYFPNKCEFFMLCSLYLWWFQFFVYFIIIIFSRFPSLRSLRPRLCSIRVVFHRFLLDVAAVHSLLHFFLASIQRTK